MQRFNYILSATIAERDPEQFLAMMNIGGTVSPMGGHTADSIEKALWVIYQSKKTREELIAALDVLPGIVNPLVVGWSIPATATELLGARELFRELDWDTVDVPDELLMRFIDNAMLRKPGLYIDQSSQRGRTGSQRVSIRPIEECPGFSPDWLRSYDPSAVRDPDMVFGPENFVVEEIVEEVSVEAISIPPAPPPGLEQRSDDAIRQWARDEIDPDLKDVEIRIERGPTRTIINIDDHETGGTITYRLGHTK